MTSGMAADEGMRASLRSSDSLRGFLALRSKGRWMDCPLVSIIMPAYNHARFIRRSMASLLAQTYPNWELVVVDDGSTDNTAEIVKSYRDPRIRYMYQENRGVKFLAATINVGLKETKGELVTMFPSDDMWPQHRLEVQVPIFRDPAVVLCFGRQLLIDENDHVIGETLGPPDLTKVENRPVGSVLHELLVSNFIPEPTVLIRRKALEKIGGYSQPPGLLAEDYPTQLALALEGEFRYLDIPLAHYRLHQTQMTRLHYSKMVETDVAFAMEFFRALDPEMQQRSGWTEASLAKALLDRLRAGHFATGRRALLAGNWKEARRHFLSALRARNPKTKAKALLGVLCSFLHLDLERIATLSGRAALK